MFFSRSVLPARRGIFFKKPSKTEQSHLHEVNINDIIARYNRTGVLGDPFKEYSEGVFSDVSSIEDFHTAQNQMVEAKASFDALPSKLRKRFNNDALQLLDFLADPTNDDEAVKLGLKVFKGVGTGTPLDVTVPTDTKAEGEESNKS